MMNVYAGKKRANLSYKFLSAFIAFTFGFTSVLPPGYAQLIPQTLLNLPAPGTMVTPSAAFVPVLLKGMTIHPENPLQFDFIIDSGNTDFKEDQIKEESQRLVKYFLASMTIPKDDLWVNLSPYESDKIIPDELGKTELGRDMLAQDYILKQLTASLMYPEKELGKEFWDKVYKLANEKYGTTEIPVNTFNKVWILPETATVYEHGQTVYIVEAKLRVMLDADYLAMSHQSSDVSHQKKAESQNLTTEDRRLTTQIVKEIILPEIEKEVNEGQNFAPLRQIYHSLILAKWYKETIKNSLLSKVYVDQKKIAGVNLDDATLKDQIYAQYMEAYKKGVFNYIKEDYDRLSNETIPRKYFSGGIKGDVQIGRTDSRNGIEGSAIGKNYQLAMEVSPQKDGASSPIFSDFFLRRKAKAMIKDKLEVEHHKLIRNKHVLEAAQILKQGLGFDVIYYPAEHVGLVGIWGAGDGNDYGSPAQAYSRDEYRWELKDNGHGGVDYYIYTKGGYWAAEERISIIKQNVQSSSPVSVNDLLNVPAGLIGALEENGQILSVKAGKIFDIGFGDYWSRIQGFAAEHSQISAVSGLVAGITITGGLYYYWSRYTVSGNIHRLNNDNWVIRKDAAIKLGELEDTSAVEPLIPMLKDKDSYSVRSAAAEALGKLGDKRAIEFLIPMLEDYDVHSAVAKALVRLGATKEQMGEGYLNALGSPNSNVRSAAARALGKLGYKRAIEFLIPILKEDFGLFFYSTAADALDRLGATKEQMGEGYLNALGSPNSNVRSAAAEALGNLGDKRAIEFLIPMLKDSDSSVRRSVVLNLSKLGASKEQIVDGYAKVLDSFPQGVDRGNVEVLREAVTALRKLGDKESIAPLNRKLASLEEELEELANTAVIYSVTSSFDEADDDADDDADFESSSPITPQEAEAMIKGKLLPEHHHLINDTHVQLAMAYEGDFKVVYHAGPPERIEIVRGGKPDQSSPSTSLGTSSPVTEREASAVKREAQKDTRYDSRDTRDEVGGIDMNSIDLDREGAGVDIQFDSVELQEIIDLGIDGFAPVIINITPLPSVLPLLGLEPVNKEEELEVSSLN